MANHPRAELFGLNSCQSCKKVQHDAKRSSLQMYLYVSLYILYIYIYFYLYIMSFFNKRASQKHFRLQQQKSFLYIFGEVLFQDKLGVSDSDSPKRGTQISRTSRLHWHILESPNHQICSVDSSDPSPRRSWLKMMRPMLQKRIRRTHHGPMMGESSMEYLCDYFPMLIIARDETKST